MTLARLAAEALRPRNLRTTWRLWRGAPEVPWRLRVELVLLPRGGPDEMPF
jgi:hypothetical protein